MGTQPGAEAVTSTSTSVAPLVHKYFARTTSAAVAPVPSLESGPLKIYPQSKMTDTTTIRRLARTPDDIPEPFTTDPVKDRREIAELDTTTHLQDFVDAIKHTRPSDIDLQSQVIDTTDDVAVIRDPAWTPEGCDTRLLEFDTGWVYTEGPIQLDALQVVALEEEIITSPDDYPTQTDFHRAMKALRARGAGIPSYDWHRPRHVPVLPPHVEPKEPEASPSHDCPRRKEASCDGELTIDETRNRCQAAIQRAIRHGEPTLIEALPTLGKSYGSVLAAAKTEEPVTILTCRGQKEQYAQFEAWADELDLDCLRLPNFFRACPSAPADTPSTDLEERISDLYRRGASGKQIHERANEVLGHPLPCEEEGDCPYLSAWNFEQDEYDILLGHYTHAHHPLAIEDRTVILDEFPGEAYERTLDENLQEAVTHFLRSYDDIAFRDFTDLLEHRDDPERRESALAWFEEADDGYIEEVFESDVAHAMAPYAVYTILEATDLGNGWEYAWPVGADEYAFDRTGLYHREEGTVYLLEAPSFESARNVIALDGTPTPEMWFHALVLEMDVRQVLSPTERRTYLRDVLDHAYIRTTEYVKPYNGSGVNVEQDAALLEAISERHDGPLGLLTTLTAEEQYEEHGVLDTVAATKHYGNLLGSNTFEDWRVGVVIGANHFGDDFVEKWSAYAFHRAERDGKGRELSYGEFGDKVRRHMLDHETLQAVMRFGRDGRGATVYVHTNTLPEWVPVTDEARIIKAWSRGTRDVIKVAAELEFWRTSDLAQHPDIDIGERQIRNILHDLTDQGYVDVSREGRGYRWQNIGLSGALDDTLTVDTVPEIEPTSMYRWEFRNRPSKRSN